MTQAHHPLDAMTAAPDHHAVLLDNEHVRILDTHLRPGECTPLHAHEWPAALYVLSWSDFRRLDEHGAVLVDSRTTNSRSAPGEALWLTPLGAHCVENVGDTDLHIIAVEMKPTSSPA